MKQGTVVNLRARVANDVLSRALLSEIIVEDLTAVGNGYNFPYQLMERIYMDFTQC